MNNYLFWIAAVIPVLGSVVSVAAAFSDFIHVFVAKTKRKRMKKLMKHRSSKCIGENATLNVSDELSHQGTLNNFENTNSDKENTRVINNSDIDGEMTKENNNNLL